MTSELKVSDTQNTKVSIITPNENYGDICQQQTIEVYSNYAFRMNSVSRCYSVFHGDTVISMVLQCPLRCYGARRARRASRSDLCWIPGEHGVR